MSSKRAGFDWDALIKLIRRLLQQLRKPASETRDTPSRRVDAPRQTPHLPTPTMPTEQPMDASSTSDIGQLFEQHRSDVMVQATGRVEKILRDDDYDADGSGRHQRLLVELDGRGKHTILIAHNLKFGRVPVREGDRLTFRGEYKWNDLGGTIHWTHHDPKQWREGGWIEHEGKRYD